MFNFSQGLPDEDTFIMSDVPKTYWSHLKAKDWSDVCKILHLKFDEILETVEIVDSSDENESE